jgi:hypothetical protein
MMILGDTEESKRPAGRIPKPYPTLNSEEIDPFTVSVKPISSDMGTNATDIATRSSDDREATVKMRAIIV